LRRPSGLCDDPGSVERPGGVIWVYGIDDGDGTLAFTDEGVEEVQFILEEYSRVRTLKS